MLGIQLVGADHVVAGASTTVTVVLSPTDDVRIAFVNATIVGSQGWQIGDDPWQHHAVNAPRTHVRLLDARPLPAGSVTRRDLVVELPDGVAPTHGLAPAWSHVEIEVHASIPAGVDERQLFRVAVRGVAPRVVTRTPASARTIGAGQTDARLELSVASSRLVAGEVLVGSVAVFHVDDRDPRRVDLTFEPTLRLIRTDRSVHVERTGIPHRHTVEIPRGGAGRGVAFQIRVPADVTPSFRAATHELVWQLVAHTPGRFLRPLDLALPLEILDHAAGAATAPLTAAPRLGNARFASVLGGFASQTGWRVVPDDDAIARVDPATGVELRLAYEYRGEAGSFLVASCSYPPLGLGLSVWPRGGRGRRLGIPAPLGVAAWDQRYEIRARRASEALPLVRHVAPAVLSAGVLGTVAWWADEALVIERKVVSLDATDLAAAADALGHLALKLAQARTHVAAPAGVEADLDGFRALARRLGCELRPGDLGIDGVLDGAPVRAQLRFGDDATALAYDISVGPTPTSTTGTDDPPVVADRALPELQIAGGAASCSLAAARLESATVRAAIDTLRTLVARLEPNSGPYR